MSILSSAYVLCKCQLCGEEKKPHTIRTRTQLPFPACVDCIENLPPIPPGKKRCPTCFAIHDRKPSYCRECSNKRRLTYHTLEKGRAWALQYLYDISPEEYDVLFSQQAGVCAVCGNPETTYDKRAKKIRSLAVDHDHKKGNVRALLCSSCNAILGAIERDPQRWKMLKKYMKCYGIEY